MTPLMLAALTSLTPVSPHPLLRLTLRETRRDLVFRFAAAPEVVVKPGYALWQFHELPDRGVRRPRTSEAESCDGQFPWVFSVDREGELRSVVYRPAQPISARDLFPPELSFHAMGMLVRKLPGDLVMLAPATSREIERLDQVILLRRSAITHLYPGLASEIIER